MCGGDLHVHLTLRAEGWGGFDLWGKEEVKVSNEIKKGQRLMNGRKKWIELSEGRDCQPSDEGKFKLIF